MISDAQTLSGLFTWNCCFTRSRDAKLPPLVSTRNRRCYCNTITVGGVLPYAFFLEC